MKRFVVIRKFRSFNKQLHPETASNSQTAVMLGVSGKLNDKMKKTKITKDDIDRVLNDKLTLKYWEFELGVGLQYEYVSGGARFAAPYPQMGKELWKSFKYELYELLCDSKSKKPREWLNDLITGDIRNLIVGICSAITAKYDITLGIALPASALVIKSGILSYCENRPNKKPKKSVEKILRSKKQKFKKR